MREEVETKQLVRAVTRNIDRFPVDFSFQLMQKEFTNLKRQFGTSSFWGGRRTAPWIFTEQGVAMLSSVLRSKRAVRVNIEIMRTLVRLRELLASHTQLAAVLVAIRQWMTPPKFVSYLPQHSVARYTVDVLASGLWMVLVRL